MDLKINDRKVVTRDGAAALITDTIGARCTVRQVDRLAELGLLEPLTVTDRRFYYRDQIMDVLNKGLVAPSIRDPEKARLRKAYGPLN